ncbi:MAG: ABC transporter permease subunit [Deltaproteobacteria bacterium]|nr:ABC transporter permease subunit [bacterium]MCB9476711.1 ABC transporter permease subunit [Deltaproteobacteria bacterium]MCB9488894.1 ABC transporter permease subunit [Deltaproteobacteria bacterium]
MPAIREIAAIARLDLSEVLRSRWLIFCVALYAVIGLVFVFVALRESTVLSFTGMSRVLFSFCHAILLVLPLLALTATGHVVNRSRDEGTLELLFSHPVTRSGYFLAVTLVRVVVLIAPLAVLIVGMAIVGRFVFGEAIRWAFLGNLLLLSSSLLWTFVGCGLAISVLVPNQAKAMIYVLLTWGISVAVMDFGLIGLMLQWRINPEGVFALALINPVQAARMALLSSAEPSLAVLGPVGFYMANRVGASMLLTLGIVWPVVAGALAWVVGYRRFRYQDLP